MVGEGVIKSFEVDFDASLLGLNACIASLKIREEVPKNEVIDELRKIQRVHFVVWGIDNTLTLIFHYHNSRDLEGIIKRIGSIKGALNLETSTPRSLLSTSVKMSPLDWEIIRSLNHDARKKNHQVAKGLAISSKTVKRRLDRLVKNRAIYFTVAVDLSKARGCIVYVLAVDLEMGAEREKIYREIKGKVSTIWGVVGSVFPSIVLFMYAERVSDIGNVVEMVKEIPGVKNVRALLYVSLHRFPKWYDKKIEEMAEGLVK